MADKEENSKLGERIRRLRKEEGFNQEELAGKADVSRAYISDIERGRRSPAYGVVKRIASALGVTIGELEGESEEEIKAKPSLRKFASKENLSRKRLRMLSRIEHKGKQPDTIEGWRRLHNVIKAMLDEGE